MNEKKKFWSLETNNIVEKICDKLFNFVSLFAILATVIVLVITIMDVVGRALFNHSVKGVMEYTQFLMVFVCYCAMPWVTWQFGHIKVDLLTIKMPQMVQSVLLVINKIICIAISAFMSYEVWIQGTQQMMMHAKGGITKLPFYPFYYLTSIMMAIVVIAMIVNLISLIALGKEKER